MLLEGSFASSEHRRGMLLQGSLAISGHHCGMLLEGSLAPLTTYCLLPVCRGLADGECHIGLFWKRMNGEGERDFVWQLRTPAGGQGCARGAS